MKNINKKQWVLISVICAIVLAGIISLIVYNNAKKKEEASIAAMSSNLYRDLYQLKNTKLKETENLDKICNLTHFYKENASVSSKEQEQNGEYAGYVFRLEKKGLYEVQSSELKQQATVMLALVPELSYVKYELLDTTYLLVRQYGENSGTSEIAVENDDAMKQHVKDGYAFQEFMDKLRPMYSSQSIHETVGKHLYDRALEKVGDEECVAESHFVVTARGRGDNTEAYVLTSIGNYRFVNGALVRLDEMYIRPAIYTVKQNAKGWYDFVHADFHPAGATTEDAIRQMFVAETAGNVINNLEFFRTDMKKQEEEAAKEYAESLNRDVAITTMEDMELTYLDSMEIPEETINKILADSKLLPYPLWIGNQEFVEDGVRYVYETAYNKVDNTIWFKKYEYNSKEVKEEYKVSAETGDYVG